jgi:CHAT domain-containing protein
MYANARVTGIFVSALVLLFTTSALANDPVTRFIVEADSIASSAGDDILARYVSDNSDLVGAAVGQLIDVAVQIGDDGQTDAAEENFDFAERIAGMHLNSGGSGAPLDLTKTYRSWGLVERTKRQKARAFEQQAVEARNAGDFDKSIELFNQAKSLHDSIGDKRSVAVIWGSLGVVYWYAGDFPGVLEQYEQALAARRAIDDRILEGKTLNGTGSVNYQLGNYAVALDFYRQAIDVRQRTGDIGGLATSLTYLGNTYLALGRILDARDAYERALPVVETAGEMEKKCELLTSIASLNVEMGRIDESNSALKEALQIAVDMDDPIRRMICHNNLALNYTDTYRYGHAIDELEAVKKILDDTPDAEQAIVYHRNCGITYLWIGELETARDELLTLVQLSRDHEMPLFEFEAYISLGDLLGELGAIDNGLVYAEKATALAKDMGNPGFAREAAGLTAELERRRGNYDRAVELWTSVLEQDKANGSEAEVVFDELGIANVHLTAGRPDQARDILRRVRPDVDLIDSGELSVTWALGMGHSFERSDPDSAHAYYQQALAIIDDAREKIGGSAVRTGYFGGVRRFYYEEVARFYAGLSLAADDEDEADLWSAYAFQTVERSKGRGLLDLMRISVLTENSPAEEAVLDSLYRLDPAAADYAEREQDLKTRYAAMRDKRVKTSVSEITRGGAIVAEPDCLRDKLSKRTTLLAYALGDTVSLLWAIDRKGCDLHEIPNRAALREDIQKFRDAIARPGLGDEALREAAHHLHEALVAPAADRIAGSKELIIIPDGFLFELPFEALIAKSAESSTPWGDLDYLARSYAVTYSPSASIYLNLRDSKKHKKYDTELLAMGDPDYTLFQDAPGASNELEPLPHTRIEVQNISASLKDKQKIVHLGIDANEAAFKNDVQSGSVRVIHLATHGLVDPVEPAASNIALCPDPEGVEDGYLHTLEILSLNTDAGIVVLSACESAGGKIGRGEGVVGLSRAFLASGTPGVVASLWPVSDESTAILMQEFYERMLRKKRPASRALNEARLALMDDSRYAHPFYWSPFVVIGLEKSPW